MIVNRSPTTPLVWNEERVPVEEQGVGSDWMVDQPTISPAKPHRPGNRSPKKVMPNLDAGPSPLAAKLCWKIWKHEG